MSVPTHSIVSSNTAQLEVSGGVVSSIKSVVVWEVAVTTSLLTTISAVTVAVFITSVASISIWVIKYVAVYSQISVKSNSLSPSVSPDTKMIETGGAALSKSGSVITTFSNEIVPVLVTMKV